MRTLGLLALLSLSLAACGGGALGTGGCADHTTTEDCEADAACKAWSCPTCGTTRPLGKCAPKGESVQIDCPAVACADPCNVYNDATKCAADSRCEVVGCPDCKGGTIFQSCYTKGQGPDLSCPALCPVDGCAKYGTEAGCDADAACHPVYLNDTTTCKCGVPGCCMRFSHCSNGPAVCSPPSGGPACFAPPPDCEGPYTVDWSAACGEGCVRKTDCPTN